MGCAVKEQELTVTCVVGYVVGMKALCIVCSKLVSAAAVGCGTVVIAGQHCGTGAEALCSGISTYARAHYYKHHILG